MTSGDLTKLFWVLHHLTKEQLLSDGEKDQVSKAMVVVHKLVTRQEAIAEARYFRNCCKCQVEIDIRIKPENFYIEKGTGSFMHITCPPLKDKDRRSIT